ncbi:MAG: alkaline phosphatase, partial [Planctomycetota bacterium]
MTLRQAFCSAVLLIASGPAGVAESPEQWFRDGRAAVEAAKRLAPNNAKARNVILFIGDGMSVSTVTAARILEGQLRGAGGEENLLSFERLPYTALIKTYNTDQQISESPGTMSAIVTGVKTKADVLSVSQRVRRGDHTGVESNRLATIVELAERAGLSTGIVTTTRVTHATPAACYAHAPERKWEDDSALPYAAREAGFPDIARQLIE